LGPCKHLLFPLPSSLIPIPISTLNPTHFPFPRESHGNPIPMGIPTPMHTSSGEKTGCRLLWSVTLV